MTSLNMTCAAGGSFYACSTGSRFVGCCLANPCANGCSAGNLVPTSFDALQYGQFADQQCNSGAFYTCIYASKNNATFMGCCVSVPCGTAGGCSSRDLAGAFLSNNPQEAEPFLSLNATITPSTSLSTTSATSSNTGATVSGSSGSTATSASSTATAQDSAQHSTISTGAIAGGVVGGIAVLAALIFGLFYLLRRKKQNKPSPPQAYMAPAAAETYNYDQSPGNHFAKPPPMSNYTTSPVQPPYSPGPPSYMAVPDNRHMSHELSATAAPSELDGGQKYDPHRSQQNSTPVFEAG